MKPNKQRGFSLTELMVAMVIGLIILAGVSSVMVSNKKTYTAQDSLARLQENARAAMLIMTRDLRNVGYWGCNPDPENVTNLLNGAATNYLYDNSTPLEGAEAGGTFYPSGTAMTLAPRANTDVLMIRGLDTSSAGRIQEAMPSTSQNIKVLDGHGLATGDVVALTDCNSTDIFQVTGIQDAGGGKDMLKHESDVNPPVPGNRELDGPNTISKAYGDDAIFMKYMSHAYFIAPGTSGEPSLFRQKLTATGPESQELVEGIENLQVQYGVDTDNDKIADVYNKANLVGAATNWNNVVSVRFGIVARALANLETRAVRTAATLSQMDTKSLDVDGDGIIEANNDFTGAETGTTTIGGETVQDRQYQRRVFRTTVLLRNMQIRN